jgi:outer membrane receptor for ferrienterochelin and colicins
MTSVYMTGSYFFPQNVTALRGDLKGHIDNHVLLLLNGRPFRDYTQGGVNSSFYVGFPVEAIQQLEIIRGPGSVLYGSNAYAGVVNVITKSARRDVRLELGTGSHGTGFGSVSGGGGNEDMDVYFNLRYLGADGWSYEATGEDSVFGSTTVGEDTLAGFLFFQYKGFSLNAFFANVEQDHLGPSPVWPSDVLEQDRNFVDLGYSTSLSTVWTLDTHLTYNDSAFEFVFDPVPPPLIPLIGPSPIIHPISESLLLEITGRASFGNGVNLSLGGVAETRQGEIETPLPGFSDIPPYDELWWRGYAQVDFKPASFVKLVGGLQWNKPENIPSDVVPRVGAIFTISPEWGAKLLYGEAFRAPVEVERSLLARPVLVGNPALTPEKIATSEAQIFYHRNDLYLAGTYFHSEQRNLIRRVATPTPPLGTFENRGVTTFQGFELEGKYSLSKNFYFLGSATYQENEDEESRGAISPVPELMAKAGFSYGWPSGVSLSLYNTYFDDAVDVTGMDTPNPPADAVNLLTADVVLNLSKVFAHNGSRNILLRIHGVNLLDEEVFTPEFVRQNINTLPSLSRRAFYGSIVLGF